MEGRRFGINALVFWAGSSGGKLDRVGMHMICGLRFGLGLGRYFQGLGW